ncbi:sigma-70 family RNA polymerase sigma factor [Tautonia plasticadhaerens]|uniref:Bacterial regulatory protein, luxR family n=1 Tax=Tautonia plasticadhaerens TaxID=2527974 RepID=A0A518H5A6_9BACT|nr:sigma-70 family RNA polymerase sigma factor [Tautonia plasticadhaerens]QDV36013.1 Bacterial regulatory protein, luxR family [Tautonia plasticadhaerens]
MSEQDQRKASRAYRPGVEGLEALRLFSGLVGAPFAIPAEHGEWSSSALDLDLDAPGAIDPGVEIDAWDAAIDLASPSELLSPEPGPPAGTAADPEAIRGGLSQLDRYLSRTWARAGLPPQKHDDCTQAVYLSLLKQLSRPGFDELMVAVGVFGIREVFSRERGEGTVFFRAIDATKKRAQRERKLRSLDDGPDNPSAPLRERDWVDALSEAIDRALSPREAELIRATLAGETPAEIAERWGVAPKTVSNEKTRAYHKLRDFLTDGEPHS